MSGFRLLGGGSDLPSIVNDVNTNILELKNQDVRKIFKDDSGTPTVVIDKDGLRTTAPGSGIDVMAATDSQLTSNTAFNGFKIIRTGTAILPGITLNSAQANGSSSVIVPHNLGFQPAIIAYGTNFSGQLTALPSIERSGILNLQASLPGYGAIISVLSYAYCSVDNTNLIIRRTLANSALGAGSTSMPDTPIKYYILQETAS